MLDEEKLKKSEINGTILYCVVCDMIDDEWYDFDDLDDYEFIAEIFDHREYEEDWENDEDVKSCLEEIYANGKYNANVFDFMQTVFDVVKVKEYEM